MQQRVRKVMFAAFTAVFATALFLLTPQPSNLANAYAYSNNGNNGENAYTNFDNHLQNLYHECNLSSKGLSFNTFKLAVTGFYNLKREGQIAAHKNRVAIVDFTKPSNEKRLYIVDLATRSLVYHTYVAHGKNSGYIYAERFSNNPESLQSSLGFYRTEETYIGQHGYSLRLDGLDKGFNENARSRAIVMHGASYVGEDYVKRAGRTGLSWGCPAVSEAESGPIIDYLKSGNCMFIYGNNINYINSSKYLSFSGAISYYTQSQP